MMLSIIISTAMSARMSQSINLNIRNSSSIIDIALSYSTVVNKAFTDRDMYTEVLEVLSTFLCKVV